MSKEKNKGLIVLVVVLSVLVVGLLGYIIYDKVNDKDDAKNNDIVDNENNVADKEENNDNVNNSNKENNYKQGIYIINDTNVDRGVLNNLLITIGVLTGNNNSAACLNNVLSSSDYKNNAKDVVSYYRDAYSMYLLKYPPNEVYSSVECGGGAADCYSISKKDAEYLFELYNFNGKINDYFITSSKLKNEYLFFYNHALGSCNYSIDHTIDSEYVNNIDIKIIDKQVVTEYDVLTTKILTTKNKTVTYTFKKNNNDNYYLSSVEVK